MRGSSAKLRAERRALRALVSRFALLWLAASALWVAPLAGSAQQGAAEDDTSGATAPRPGVEEIMVIGDVLESSTQAESEAITTFDQTELDTLGITNIETLALNTPSLHVGQVGQSAIITLRGVGLENLTSLGEGGVGFQVDQVHLGRPSASNALFFDLEKADVIRGPVGTRGGRQTNGGRIVLDSKRPDEELNASADLTLGNYDHLELRSILNVPIWEDKLLTRASVLYREHRGYQDLALSGVNSDDPGDADDFAGRGQIRSLWFDQALEIRAIGTRATQKGNGPAVKLIGPPPSTLNNNVNAFPPNLLAPYLVNCPDPPQSLVPPEACNTGDPRESFADYRPFRDNEQNGITGIVTWDVPYFADTPVSDLRLGFIGSWQQNIEDGAIDFDGTNIPEQIFDQRRNSKQQSFEAYLERLDVGMWDFRAGVYFYEENIDTDLCFDVGVQRPGPDIHYRADIQTKSVASYGELGYRPFENLRLFGGLRWTKDEKEANELIQGFDRLTPTDPIPPPERFISNPGDCGRYFRDLVGIAPDPSVFQQPNPPIACCTIIPINEDERKLTSDEFQGVTPMGGFEWQVTDTSTLGFSITRGFKSGGFPLAVPTDLAAGTVKRYDSEFVMEYELTSKNEFFDDRLRINVTGFWMEYEPFQICQFNGPSFFCRSDGSATIRGVEIEWRATPIDGLALNGHFNYLDSRINDFQIQDPTVRVCLQVQTNCPSNQFPPQPTLPAQTVDVSGNQQPKAPTYAGSFGIQYDFELGTGLGLLTPRFQTQFQGKTFYRVFNREEFSNDDYMKFDAKLTWASESERYAVEAFVVNLTDVDVLNSLFVGSVFSGGQVLGQYQAPRTYGMKFSVNYVSDWLEDLL